MLARTLAGVVGRYCFFSGLKYLPITTVDVLFFTFPLFLTTLSGLLLGERVGLRRWGGGDCRFLRCIVNHETRCRAGLGHAAYFLGGLRLSAGGCADPQAWADGEFFDHGVLCHGWFHDRGGHPAVLDLTADGVA